MKQRPNISVQQKSNTKLEYLKYLATENIQPNVSVPVYVAPKGKTKSKPNIKVQTRNLDAINKHRIDMMNYVNRELSVFADGIATHYIGDPLDGIINYYDKILEFAEKKYKDEFPKLQNIKTGFYGMNVDIEYDKVIQKLKKSRELIQIM